MQSRVDWKNTTVTVTGGAGFLGRVVCDKLRTRNCRAIRVPRSANYKIRREVREAAERGANDDLAACLEQTRHLL